MAAICDLRQEVNSGGFDRYFRYWGGNCAQVALSALPQVLGKDWADLLRNAMTLLGTEYPSDPDERGMRIDESPDLDNQLEELDDRCFELEEATGPDRLMSENLAGGC